MATQEDKVPVGLIMTVGVVGAIVTFAMVMAAQFIYYQLGEAEFRRKNSAPPKALTAYEADQDKQLSTYGWSNKDEKKVAIPIERAITLTAESGGSLPKPTDAEEP